MSDRELLGRQPFSLRYVDKESPIRSPISARWPRADRETHGGGDDGHRHGKSDRGSLGPQRNPRLGTMKRQRTIVSHSPCSRVRPRSLPAAALAGAPLLSGYGGPGAGAQAILGATLLNGPGSGSSGSGSSGGSSASGRRRRGERHDRGQRAGAAPPRTPTPRRQRICSEGPRATRSRTAAGRRRGRIRSAARLRIPVGGPEPDGDHSERRELVVLRRRPRAARWSPPR